MPRSPGFDLATELGKPSFTPSLRDAPALVELLAGGDERAGAALARLGSAAQPAIAAQLATPDDAARARLVGALARAGDEAGVIAQLGDPAPRVRRAAASALGKARGEPARAALLARWDASDVTPDERRVLAEALGKIGGDGARKRLQTIDPAGDQELARRRDRALLVIERESHRAEDSQVAIDVPPPAPVTVRLHCKAGLAAMLAEDFVGAAVRGDAAVDIELAEPWQTLHRSRLWMTAGIRIAMPGGHADLVDTICSPRVRSLLTAWTTGPIRWRLDFARGHQRATVWKVAREVAARAPELINDPTASTWELHVDAKDQKVLELVPKRAADPRFAWRVAEVPAASHPTVAAALAHVAAARDDDRVWDPFVGSGAELIERGRLGPYRALAGSDLADRALDAARANLAAAGFSAELALADARTHAPGPVELIITNPPLGSRVRVDASGLLAAALPNLAAQLAPGGRLVWITPAPQRTGPIAQEHGLRRTRAITIDLGGVRGVLERWER